MPPPIPPPSAAAFEEPLDWDSGDWVGDSAGDDVRAVAAAVGGEVDSLEVWVADVDVEVLDDAGGSTRFM